MARLYVDVILKSIVHRAARSNLWQRFSDVDAGTARRLFAAKGFAYLAIFFGQLV